MTAPQETIANTSQPLVSGRYRVESRLGKGGMGAVYRAYDLVEGRHVALKRLLVTGGDDHARVRMFEREYHALSGLRHPRIIEVHDYGVDEHGAYYTMELLDGRDLRELAPLPYETVCLYMRDVACSLALLHARRLLHRDLSARNVRITSDGRAKLIDFGALTSFGKSATVVGTPPGVAPEALYGGELDQRVDLYALGALAYWALTGQQAYNVKKLDELPEAWARPLRPPSEVLAERVESRAEASALPNLPPALEELVLSLLHHNPLARPSSAVEVLARLTVIARLPEDQEPLSPASYLRGGVTVGRVRERAQLRKRLKLTLSGQGSVVAVRAEHGMGCGRIFSELAIEARQLGATAVALDASEHPSGYGVAGQIVQALLVAQPERARRAMRSHEATLMRVLPGPDGRVSTQRLAPLLERSEGDPREQRLRTQAALEAFVSAILEEVPVLLAVRGFEHADEASAAWIASLARASGPQRLMIALSFDPLATAAAPAALGSLCEDAVQLTLRGLSRDELSAMLEGTFGAVDHVERLADFLHRLTAGNPQHCLDLVRHMVEQGVIVFRHGVWALPMDLDDAALPTSLSGVLASRVARAGPYALKLAQSLSVHRGPIPLERVTQLGALASIPAPLRALDELEQLGLLISDEQQTRFAHERAHDAVLQTLGADERRRLHAQLGSMLERDHGDDPVARLDAGYHLLHAGQETHGADLLAQVGVELAQSGDGIPIAVPALEAALEVYRKQGRGARDLGRVLGPLAIAGFYQDREVIERYGEQAEAVLSGVLGLTLAARLRPLLGGWLSAWVGIASGFVRAAFVFGPRRARNEYEQSVMLYGKVITVLMGLCAVTLDTARPRGFAARLEPLTVLGREHPCTFIHRFGLALALIPEDRSPEALEQLRALVGRLDDPRPLPGLTPALRAMAAPAMLYALGGMLGIAADPEALVVADRLEASGSELYAMFANQVRAAYHGTRGEAALAEAFRERVARYAMQAGSSWQAEIWATCSAIQSGRSAEDLLMLKGTAARLERLARTVPSLQRHAQLAASACLSIQGDAVGGHKITARVLAGSPPRGYVGWGVTVAAHIENMARLGDVAGAKAMGLEALAQYDAQDRLYAPFIMPLIRSLALIDAQLGDCNAGADRIERYLDEISGRGGPTTLAVLYEARAQIALRARDLDTARAYAGHMRHEVEPTDNPALIARCERLQRELDTQLVDYHESRPTLDFNEPIDARAKRAVLQGRTRSERYERALMLLLDNARVSAGHLFAYDDGALSLAAGPPEDLEHAQRAARIELEEFLQPEGATQVTGSLAGNVTGNASGMLSVGGDEDGSLGEGATGARGRHEPSCYVLRCEGRRGERVIGIAVLHSAGQYVRPPVPALLDALADALADPETVESSRAKSPPRPVVPT